MIARHNVKPGLDPGIGEGLEEKTKENLIKYKR